MGRVAWRAEGVKTRRHHNTDARRQIKRGKTREFVRRLAARLGIPYKPAVAQWTEQGSSIPTVEGTNPSRRANTSEGDA